MLPKNSITSRFTRRLVALPFVSIIPHSYPNPKTSSTRSRYMQLRARRYRLTPVLDQLKRSSRILRKSHVAHHRTDGHADHLNNSAFEYTITHSFIVFNVHKPELHHVNSDYRVHELVPAFGCRTVVPVGASPSSSPLSTAGVRSAHNHPVSNRVH